MNRDFLYLAAGAAVAYGVYRFVTDSFQKAAAFPGEVVGAVNEVAVATVDVVEQYRPHLGPKLAGWVAAAVEGNGQTYANAYLLPEQVEICPNGSKIIWPQGAVPGAGEVEKMREILCTAEPPTEQNVFSHWWDTYGPGSL